MSKIIVLMGAPGAGKGTQARLAAATPGVAAIFQPATCFVLWLRRKRPLAEEVRPLQQAGKLIPDELVIRWSKIEPRRTIAKGFHPGWISANGGSGQDAEQLAARRGRS